ncbi:MAG TPA: hypothetical protein VIQ25_18430, partial [Gemmatimonadales bacterium]
MRWKDLRAAGGSVQRLHSLPARRGTPCYTDRERAALAGAEAVTLVADWRVPQRDYEGVRPYFSEKELSDLTLAIAAIDPWSRLSIAARLTPGTCHPAG